MAEFTWASKALKFLRLEFHFFQQTEIYLLWLPFPSNPHVLEVVRFCENTKMVSQGEILDAFQSRFNFRVQSTEQCRCFIPLTATSTTAITDCPIIEARILQENSKVKRGRS